jgi:c-di-GMP-binding flagellar brake protein YcgR
VLYKSKNRKLKTKKSGIGQLGGDRSLRTTKERYEMNDNADKRQHTRVQTHIHVRYRNLRDGAGVHGESSISADVGEGGVRFRAGEFISMACRLILELDIPMCSKPIKAISRVAWIRKSDSGDEYEIGNQFLEMSKEDKELISEYVDSVNHASGSGTEFSVEIPQA